MYRVPGTAVVSISNNLAVSDHHTHENKSVTSTVFWMKFRRQPMYILMPKSLLTGRAMVTFDWKDGLVVDFNFRLYSK